MPLTTNLQYFPLAITGTSTSVFNLSTNQIIPGTISLASSSFRINLYNRLTQASDTSVSSVESQALAVLETSTWDLYTTSGSIRMDTGTATTGGSIVWDNTSNVVTTMAGVLINPINMLKDVIKSNLLIKVKSRRDSVVNYVFTDNEKEEKARNTLRDMLTEKEWRRYVTNGFVMLKGTSGYWYQIFNNSYNRIRVYKDGKFVNHICIHTDKSCPPTDHVINMMTLIEIDEAAIWMGGNVYNNDSLAPSGFCNTWTGKDALEENGNLIDKYRKAKEVFNAVNRNVVTSNTYITIRA